MKVFYRLSRHSPTKSPDSNNAENSDRDKVSWKAQKRKPRNDDFSMHLETLYLSKMQASKALKAAFTFNTVRRYSVYFLRGMDPRKLTAAQQE